METKPTMPSATNQQVAIEFLAHLTENGLPTISINEFIKRHQTVTIDGVKFRTVLPTKDYIDKKGETRQSGTKSNLTLEHFKDLHLTGVCADPKPKEKGQEWSIDKRNQFNQEYWEIRPSLSSKQMCIIDVDGINENGDVNLKDLLDPENSYLPEELYDISFFVSRKKHLPHFVFYLENLPPHVKIENYQDCLKFAKADILLNHAWERMDKPIFKLYNYKDDLKTIDWNIIKTWIDTNSDTGKKLMTEPKQTKPKKETKPKQKLIIENDSGGDSDCDSEVSNLTETDNETGTGTTNSKVANYQEKKTRLEKIAKCWKENQLDEYKIWLEYSFAFINIFGNSEQAQNLWEKYNKQFCNRYDGNKFEKKNDKMWDSLVKTASKNATNRKLGWGRLIEWAKANNITEYEKQFPYSSTNIDFQRLTDYTFALEFKKKFYTYDGDKSKVVFTGKDKDIEGFYYNGIYWKPLGLNNAEICKNNFAKLYDYYCEEFAKVEDEYDFDEKPYIWTNIKSLDSASRRSAIIKVLTQENYEDNLVWNKNLNLFAFEDCVYDLEKGEFVRPSPEQYINTTCGYALGATIIDTPDKYEVIPPVLERETKFFEDKTYKEIKMKDGKPVMKDGKPVEEDDDKQGFLWSIFEDEEMINFIWKMMASFLKQQNIEEKCYFWLGKGRNGKGTLTTILKLAFGNYFGELGINYWTQYSKGEDTANANLCSLRYARILNTSETGEDNADPNKPIRFITDKYKRITGGDTIKVRNLFSKTPIEFIAGKPLIQTNMMPELVNISNADNYSLRERTNIIKFPFVFVSKDKLDPTNKMLKAGDTGLKEKFQDINYARAFILILIRKYKDYKKDRLTEPESVKQAKLEYFDRDLSQFKHWFYENIQKIPEPKNHDYILVNDIHQTYYAVGNKLTKSKVKELCEKLCGTAPKGSNNGVANVSGTLRLRGYEWIQKDDPNNYNHN